jgi:HEPN domain-containing protein
MPPDSPRVKEASEWFLRAARDLRAAEALLNVVPPLLGEVAFHCQQATEKAMKAISPGTMSLSRRLMTWL